MIRIAVSQRIDVYPDRQEHRDALDQRLTAFLAEIGALAMPVPNALMDRGLLPAWLKTVEPSGILLSGGNDIGTQPDRDATEYALLDWAAERALPLLGLCRGMQVMAVAAGGRLKAAKGHVGTRHRLQGEIAQTVNSFHNSALDICPEGYRVLATSDDGSIEAIRHCDRPFEGWMWHPERETVFAAGDLQRARRIFDA